MYHELFLLKDRLTRSAKIITTFFFAFASKKLRCEWDYSVSMGMVSCYMLVIIFIFMVVNTVHQKYKDVLVQLFFPF